MSDEPMDKPSDLVRPQLSASTEKRMRTLMTSVVLIVREMAFLLDGEPPPLGRGHGLRTHPMWRGWNSQMPRSPYRRRKARAKE